MGGTVPQVRARVLLVVGMASSLLAGLAVAESTGATTSQDTVVESSVTSTPEAVAETSVTTTGEASAVEILRPDEPWGGATLGEWNARWYQWALSMPEDVNPNRDATGERCGYGQFGPVFLLPGTVDDDGVTCVVAEGTAILVIVANINCSTIEPPPFFGRDEDELRACVAENMDLVSDLQARVNGQDVANLEEYRTATPLFTVTIPEDNPVGAEPGVAQFLAEAYSFIIAPPPPGEYEIAVSAIYAGDPYPNKVTVIVQAPQVIEPPTT